MSLTDWVEEFEGAITICDAALVGTNVLDCHPQHARGTIERLLETGERNVYTIVKRGVRKLIYQAPWFRGGERAGILELSVVLPEGMPEHVRG
jgi:hypothetical protein